MGEEYRQERDWNKFNSRWHAEFTERMDGFGERFGGKRLATFLREQSPILIIGEYDLLKEMVRRWKGHSTQGYNGTTGAPMAEFHRKRYWSFVVGDEDYIKSLTEKWNGIIMEASL